MLKQNDSSKSQREIKIVRVFKAPRELVFKAWTEPKHIEQWWGPKGFTTRVTEMDFRPGGQWRYVLHDSSNGVDHGFSGEYREIIPSEKLVASERYEPVPNSDHLNTLTLTEQDGKTTLQILILHSSIEQRDGHLQSGMETGLNKSLNRLERLLESIA